MKEFTDFVEFDRPEGKKVRIVFELYRNEILFHYCQFRHNEEQAWSTMKMGDDGYHTYFINENEPLKVLYPTRDEIMAAQDEINKKYNILEA